MAYDVKFGINAGVTGNNKVDALAKSVKSLDSTGDSLARTFVTKVKPALMGFGALLTAGAVATFSKSVINLGDQLNDMRQKTGIAVETLAQFKGAADTGGSSLESLSGALVKMNKNMVAAIDGSKQQQKAFAALGVDITDSDGKLRKSNEVLLDIADGMAGLEDGAGKTALAMSIFGKSGADIIPFLNQGRDQIEKMSLALSGEFAQNADDFNDSLAMMKNRLIELGANAITPLLPALTEMNEGFSDGIQEVTENVGPLADALGDLAEDVGITASAVFDMTKVFADSFAVVELFKGALFLLDNVLKLILITVTAVAGGIAKLANGIGAFVEVGGAGLEKLGALATGQKSRTNILGAGGIVEQWKSRDQSIDARFGQRIFDIAGAGGAGSAAGDDGASPPRAGGFNGFGDEAFNDGMESFILKQKQGIQALKDEISMIGKTKLEIEKLKAAREIDNAAQDAAKKMSADQRAAIMAQAEAYKEETLALIDLKYQQERTFGAGAKAAFNDYIDSAGNAANQAKKLFGNAMQGMEDVLTDFVTTGKANFKDFAASIIKDIVRIHIQSTITTPIAGFLSNLAGSLFSTAGSGYNPAVSAPPIKPFEMGGIMTPTGAIQLNKYENGGVANSPQLAMFGEGRTPEAYVPLPDGRTIPVTIKGGSAGAGGVEVNIYMGNGSQTTRGNDGNGDVAKLAGVIKGVMQNEMRQGGLLSAYAR